VRVEPSTIQKRPMCADHDDDVQFVCLTDLVLLCRDCVLTGAHDDHKFVPFQDFVRDLRSEISAGANRVASRKETLRVALHSLSSMVPATLAVRRFVASQELTPPPLPQEYDDTCQKLAQRSDDLRVALIRERDAKLREIESVFSSRRALSVSNLTPPLSPKSPSRAIARPSSPLPPPPPHQPSRRPRPWPQRSATSTSSQIQRPYSRASAPSARWMLGRKSPRSLTRTMPFASFAWTLTPPPPPYRIVTSTFAEEVEEALKYFKTDLSQRADVAPVITSPPPLSHLKRPLLGQRPCSSWGDGTAPKTSHRRSSTRPKRTRGGLSRPCAAPAGVRASCPSSGTPHPPLLMSIFF
jgi:hypothetical protein